MNLFFMRILCNTFYPNCIMTAYCTVNHVCYRSSFINNSVAFAVEHGFDGISLDFQYPGNRDTGSVPGDKTRFATLCQVCFFLFLGFAVILPAKLVIVNYTNIIARSIWNLIDIRRISAVTWTNWQMHPFCSLCQCRRLRMLLMVATTFRQ